MAVQPRSSRPSFPKRGKLTSEDLNEFGTNSINDITALTNQSNAEEANRIALARMLKDHLVATWNEIDSLKSQIENRRRSFAARGVRIDHAIYMGDTAGLLFPTGSPANLRAAVSPIYGQATIPVNGIEQKFFALDFRSNEVVTPTDLVTAVTGTFDKALGDGLVDYEYSGTVTAGDATLAFNGSNTEAWIRQISFDLDSDVDSVECQLTVQVPNQTNVYANSITLNCHPWRDVDVTGLFISATIGSSFVAVPGFAEKRAAGNERFFFPSQSVAQIKVRLRQRNWRALNGKKVFRYGLEELGLQLIDWDKTYSSSAAVTENHTLIHRVDAPEGYLFALLDGFWTTPNFINEDAGSRHMHFKVAADIGGSTVFWDSDQNAVPQTLNSAVSLGRAYSTIYVFTTLNWVASSGGANSPFQVGASPFLASIGLTYSVVPE